MAKKTGLDIAKVLIPIIYGILAIVLAAIICWSGQYPSGSETMNHIYRGNVIYTSIKEGNLFPLYDEMWYSGVEFIRACSPLPAYFMAFCNWICKGNLLNGYMLYIAFIFLIGAFAWHFIGKKKDRLYVGSFIGVLWFCMPYNLYIMFIEGNLARSLCVAFLPIYINTVYDYLIEHKRLYLVKLIVISAMLSLCDLEYVIMLLIGTLIFLVIYEILYNQWLRALDVVIAEVLAFLAVGIWTIPAMMISSSSNNVETLGRYFQSVVTSLNPVERIQSDHRYYYFGLAAFLLMFFGLACSKKRNTVNFLVPIIIFFLTANSFYPVLSILPGKEYYMMWQYVSYALCLILYGLLRWKTLRYRYLVIICVLLTIDVIPSLRLIYGDMNGVAAEDRFDEMEETTLIKKAKEITDQRIAFFDGGDLETLGTYLLSEYNNGKPITFGGDWAYAETNENLMQLSRAMDGGFYPYVFDRCKELGNDTVLIKMSEINTLETSTEQLDAIAKRVGYTMVDSNEFYRLYNIDVTGNWGTIAKYDGIGIGTTAREISLAFPTIKEVSTTNINDFTYEELSQYKVIYLSGFTYDDKEEAEEMMLKLSEEGVRIIILADGIPEDEISHARDFLGVVCNDISFTNGYPILNTKIGQLDGDFFPQGYENWETVYVNGLDDVWGTVMEGDIELDFYGTVKNENIIVVGLNLTMYYGLTANEGIGELLADITKFAAGRLPEREIVPLTIDYVDNSIVIESEKDGVNTSLASQGMFDSGEDEKKENHLLYVDSGKTKIKVKYPYFVIGLISSVLGIGASVVFVVKRGKKIE